MDNIDVEKLMSIQPAEYRKLMYGEWLTPTKQEHEDAAREYHERCDAYDQRVCTAISPRTGEPMPANGEELAAINANAWHVRKDILARYGLTEVDLHKAIVAYRR